MRSRYAAYVLGLHDYLWQTWHPSTRPELEHLGGTTLHWIHLSIITFQAGLQGDKYGEVHFIASYIHQGKGTHLEEQSRFICENGSWLYLDGECSTTSISRNEVCPCASGNKFKRCCL